ncbi:MAG: ChaN family lipoprotein [Bdellovibrionales bacterium]
MIALLFALLCQASATTWQAQNEAIWDVNAHRFISLAEFNAQAGDILVFGEEHAVKGNQNDSETYIHHDNQLRLIQQLKTAGGPSVSVGMEFLIYTFQDLVNQFLGGILPEADFLKQVNWGSNPFAFYRRQILAPAGTSGKTVALNIPSDVADQIAKGGKDSLDARQLALTPAFWERGNDSYFERFSEVMKDHAPPDAIDRYFWAQSLWDDTMAWKALQHRAQNPDDILVIIVGSFHVEFGGGLPFELKKNGATRVKTILQISAEDWTPSTLKSLVEPDPKYGNAADYLWLHTGAVQTASFFP